MEVIAKLLRDAREDADLSQLEVMEKTGISNKALSRYENNITEPDIETLASLCRLYGLSLDRALALSPEKTNMLLTPQEIRFLKKLRELPDDFQKMMMNEVDVFSAAFKKNK